MKAILLPKLIYLVLIITFLNACGNKEDNEKVPEQTEAKVQSIEKELPIVQTDSAPIAEGIECAGKVQLPPQGIFSIHSKVDGYVKSVRLIEGQLINKGNILAVIESPSFAIIQREFLKASATYAFAKDNFKRKSVLSENNSISEKEIQVANKELKTAEADYLGLKAELSLMGFNTSEIEKGNIQHNLAIFSRINGYVTKVAINNGKKVNPDDLLFEIIDRSNVHIQMQVNSKDVRQLKEGDKFTVIIPGEERKFRGSLHYINKQIEAETNTVIIHGHLDKAVDANELLVGSMVFIKF